jgi:hypothetical protein
MYFAGLDTHESRWEGVRGWGSTVVVAVVDGALADPVKKDVRDLTEPDRFLACRSFDFADAGGLESLVFVVVVVVVVVARGVGVGVVCALGFDGRPLSFPLSLSRCC